MSKKIKITYFLHFPLGEENSTIYIKDLLNSYFLNINKKASVLLFASKTRRDFYHNSPLDKNITAIILDEKTNRNPLKKTIAAWHAVNEADVCFLFMPCMTSVLAGILCKLKRKPFVTYFGANWYNLIITNNPKQIVTAKIKRFLSNMISKRSLFSLHTGKGILESHKGKNKYLTAPILNLSTEMFYKRKTYNYLSTVSEIKLLFVGALTERKGVSYLLQALTSLNNSKLFLHIVGDGTEKENLKRMTVELGISNQVQFHDFVANGPNLFSLYQKCDIFILPSFSEGFPRVLYEAAGNGCPIITTPVNSIPYTFQNNHDCLFINPGNKDDIVSAINRVINEPGLNKKLAMNAYNTIEPILKEKAYDQHYHLIEKHLK
jgi:glycosyltransferase involved in cell wall biosynthesis